MLAAASGALRNISRSSSCSASIIDHNGITALSILCASSKHHDVLAGTAGPLPHPPHPNQKPPILPGTLCNLALVPDSGVAIFNAGCCPVLAKLCISTHENVAREAVGFIGNMAALPSLDSARLGAICIENVCYVVKHNDNPRVLLLALGALNNLTKSCPANRDACIHHVIAMRLVKMLKEGAAKDVLLQLVTLLWNLSLTPAAARALVVSGAHNALSQATLTGIEIKRAAAGDA